MPEPDRTPRPVGRAAALVALLCLAALVLALALTRAVEWAHPGLTRAPVDTFAPLHIGKIDLHEELGPSSLETALHVARDAGVGTLVNLAGGSEGGRLEAQLAGARSHGPHAIVFANLDLEGCCGGGWAAREVSRLSRARALGARGLSILEAPAPLTSSEGEPIWSACAALGWPVVLGEVGTLEDRLRLVERHRAVAFVAARSGLGADDTTRLLGAMDRLQNLWLDTAGRVWSFGRSPSAARAALLAHFDRILFGSGLKYLEAAPWQGVVLESGPPVLLDRTSLKRGAGRLFFESTLRLFETRDARIPQRSPDGPEELAGLGLPLEVLRHMYHQNAEKLLGLAAEVP